MALMLWSLWIIGGFGFYTVGVRLWTQIDGVVTASRDNPPNRGPRYATEYKFRGPDGKETLYIAGTNDSSLRRSMPVGTVLKKKRWHLDYERNGQRIDDFAYIFYLIVLSGACGCLGWSIVQWRKDRLEEAKWLSPDGPKSLHEALHK
jgi:hypothetical protein